MSTRKISACLSPALLPYYGLENTVAVVIDVFRATSSICHGLSNGAEAIIPVAELEECLAYKEKGYLLAAEREGKVVDGFDFGNSPFSYSRERVAGKTVVLTTTNGTRAIQLCREAAIIVAGSFGNISILSEWLAGIAHNVLLVCAGWKNHVGLEDTVFAGAVIRRIKTADSILDDSAQIAERLYLEGQDNLGLFLKDASHTKRMQKLDVTQDIEFCLQPDTAPVIPVLEAGMLIRMRQPNRSLQ